MKKQLLAVVCFAVAALATGCNKDDDNAPQSAQKATINVKLTDGPGNYEHVYLDIREVQVTMEGSSAVVLTPIRPGIYDLLTFRNGLDTLLITAQVPAAKISQIRLILGDNNSVVVDGQAHALTTPSAQESGVKLNLHQTLAAGVAYNIWLDFDAGKSIHETGNGKFMLKPVIRAYTDVTNGQVMGYVTPLGSFATVYAISGTDTFSAIPAANGYFAIHGLPEGSYQIWVDPGVALYQDLYVNNIAVKFGAVVNLGTLTLLP